MSDVNEVQLFTDAVMSMTKEDQASGQIPPDVSSLDELDNYVDIDVGRAAGYVSQAEAQAVGREHAHAHGGGFYLRRA